MTDDGAWVSLFSGGKDSSWALYRALRRRLPVARLVTVHADAESYMYHVPATDLAGLAADSIGIDLVEAASGDRDHANCESSVEHFVGERARIALPERGEQVDIEAIAER
ncbi:MAG: ATP-binding protein, partial [Halobacteriales archaeon SW_9_67_24]